MARSATPVLSGSLDLTCTILVGTITIAATPLAELYRRQMPVSLSHVSRRGTAPREPTRFHIPANGSPVIGDGSIQARMNRECEDTITSRA